MAMNLSSEEQRKGLFAIHAGTDIRLNRSKHCTFSDNHIINKVTKARIPVVGSWQKDPRTKPGALKEIHHSTLEYMYSFVQKLFPKAGFVIGSYLSSFGTSDESHELAQFVVIAVYFLRGGEL